MQTRAKSAMVRIRLGFSNSRPTCAKDLDTPRTPHLSPTPVLVDFAVEAGRVPEQQARRGSLLFDAAFQQKSLETNSIRKTIRSPSARAQSLRSGGLNRR